MFNVKIIVTTLCRICTFKHSLRVKKSGTDHAQLNKRGISNSPQFGFVWTSYIIRVLIKISSVIFQMFIETQNIVELMFEDFCTVKSELIFCGLRTKKLYMCDNVGKSWKKTHLCSENLLLDTARKKRKHKRMKKY
jgi:hypothetical protein